MARSTLEKRKSPMMRRASSSEYLPKQSVEQATNTSPSLRAWCPGQPVRRRRELPSPQMAGAKIPQLDRGVYHVPRDVQGKMLQFRKPVRRPTYKMRAKEETLHEN